MEIKRTIKETREITKQWRKEGKAVALVPTMGYLHEGHQSLIRRARQENDKVVVSVFVNPLQFGEGEDYETYPRDIDRDSKICLECGADIIFYPEVKEMYGNDFGTYVDMENLTKGLCGRSRPVHFKGVQTVVSKLFNIVKPDRAYFGQKDAQQLAIIKKMTKDLNFDIEIIGCPIIREDDGLAKSSRNTYLSPKERKAAVIISKALNKGKEAVIRGENDAQKIKNIITNEINTEHLAKIDYVEAVSFKSLEPLKNIEFPLLVAAAVYIGSTRLIDNFIIEEQ